MPLATGSQSSWDRATNLFGSGSSRNSNTGNFGWQYGGSAPLPGVSQGTWNPSLGSTSQNNPLLNWLNSQSNAQLGYFGTLQGGLYSQLNSLNAYTNTQSDALRSMAGLQGNLLNQGYFRDVTLGYRANELDYRHALAQYGLGQSGVASDLRNAQRVYEQQRSNAIAQQNFIRQAWEEEQRYINELRDFNRQEYELSGRARDDTLQTAQRDWAENKSNISQQLQRLQEQLQLDTNQLRQLSQMSAAQRDRVLADLAAERGFTDRQFSELQRQLHEAQNLTAREWGEAQRTIEAQRGLADRSWAEMQRDIDAQRLTTDEQIAIARWLNEQNVGFNDQALQLALRQARFQEEQQARALQSNAIARGAMTSAGFGDDRNALAQLRGFTDESSRMQHAQTAAQLDAGMRSDENAYQAALNRLTNAYNTGQIGYDAELERLLTQQNQAQLSYDRDLAAITGAFNESAINYDRSLYGLGAAARDARAQHDDTVARLRMDYDQARLADAMRTDALYAQQRANEYQFQDVQTALNRQAERDWLNYVQGYSALQNRFNTGDIQQRSQAWGVTNQALLNRIGYDYAQTQADLAMRNLRSNMAYQTGQYDLQNAMLRSLGQTYGTRSQMNQADLRSSLNQLRYQQTTGINSLNAQRAQLAQQQMNALQSLISQVAPGLGGRFYWNG